MVALPHFDRKLADHLESRLARSPNPACRSANGRIIRNWPFAIVLLSEGLVPSLVTPAMGDGSPTIRF